MSGSILDRLSGGDLNSQIANPKGVNLLADYAGAAEAARGIWGAREMQAKQAAGEAFRNSLNPDGTPNQLRLNQNLAANPATSLVAQQSAQSGQTLDNETFETHMKRLTGVNSAAMALTAQYPKGVPQQAVYDELDRVGPTMGLSPQQIAQAKTSFGDDPQANSLTLIRNGISNLQAQAAMHASRPGTGTQTGPGGITMGFQTAPAASLNPGAVSVPPQAGAPQGLSPEAATTPTQIGVVPSGPNRGAPITGTRQQFINTVNGQPNVGPGRLPAALAPSQAAPAQPQGIVTGLGPGATTAATEAAGASAKDFQGIADAGTQAQTRGAVLDNMLSDTSQFTTGPGADVIQRVRAVANRMGLNVDTEKLSASESFNKLAAALAQQQQRGAGSDAQLGVSQSANPHADLSPAGVDLMLRQLRGNEDYLQARQKLAATFPDRTDRTAFEDQIGRKLDPRTFQYDRMTPPQKMTYFKSLGTDKAKEKFIEAHGTAASLLGAQ